jgi:hypothetical protein
LYQGTTLVVSIEAEEWRALQFAGKLVDRRLCNRARFQSCRLKPKNGGLYSLRENSLTGGFVTGHDFSRAAKANQILGL